MGDRQRLTPAQDPNQPEGKILRLTLDGKPAPGNPMEGKTGAQTIPLIDPASDTEAAKTAPVVSTYTFPGPNLTPAETWSSGHRTPYGLAFGPDGRLWELEHGPRGGDKLNLIEPGKNYGWPLVSYGPNYNGVPIPSFDTRPDLAKPVIYWVPVIAPGNLMFYKGSVFPWDGNGLISGLGPKALVRSHVRRQGRRHRGPALERRRARPRHRRGAGRFALDAGRRQSRRPVPPHAEIVRWNRLTITFRDNSAGRRRSLQNKSARSRRPPFDWLGATAVQASGSNLRRPRLLPSARGSIPRAILL